MSETLFVPHQALSEEHLGQGARFCASRHLLRFVTLHPRQFGASVSSPSLVIETVRRVNEVNNLDRRICESNGSTAEEFMRVAIPPCHPNTWNSMACCAEYVVVSVSNHDDVITEVRVTRDTEFVERELDDLGFRTPVWS